MDKFHQLAVSNFKKEGKKKKIKKAELQGALHLLAAAHSWCVDTLSCLGNPVPAHLRSNDVSGKCESCLRMEGMAEEHPFLERGTPHHFGLCYIAQFPLQVAARNTGHPGDE